MHHRDLGALKVSALGPFANEDLVSEALRPPAVAWLLKQRCAA